MAGVVLEQRPVVLEQVYVEPEVGASLVLLDTMDAEAVATRLVRRHEERHGGEFRLVAPAARAPDGVLNLARHEGVLTSGAEDARFVVARWRLAAVLDRLRASGLDVDGDVDEPVPLRVVTCALDSEVVDEVLLVGRGRAWSRRGTAALAKRLRRHLAVPVLEL